MKNLNLGKIIVLFLIITNILYASVNASLSQNAVYKGDMVNLTLSASGDDIKFPSVYDIAGYKVLGVSSSSSTSIINGNISKTVSKTYMFKPTSSITIPSFSIKVDAKVEKTQPLKLSVLKPTASKNGDDFILEATLSKDTVYTGQEVMLTLKFKHKLNARANKLELNEPQFDNIWIKELVELKTVMRVNISLQLINFCFFHKKMVNLI